MSKANNLTDFLTDTAKAIRSKKGTTGKINPQNFASEIESISTTPKLQSKTVTPSKTQQTITPSSGFDGLSSVVVDGDDSLVSSNIRSGVRIFGVYGNLHPLPNPRGWNSISLDDTLVFSLITNSTSGMYVYYLTDVKYTPTYKSAFITTGETLRINIGDLSRSLGSSLLILSFSLANDFYENAQGWEVQIGPLYFSESEGADPLDVPTGGQLVIDTVNKMFYLI